MKQVPHFGFLLSAELAAELKAFMLRWSASSNKKALVEELYGLITKLSTEGLDYFFVQTLRKAKINALSLKAVEMAIRTGQKAVLSLGKTILKGMSEAQLEVVMEMIKTSYYGETQED